MVYVILFLIAVVIVITIANLKVVPQAHAYVVERLGAYKETWNVGFHVKTPLLDKVANKVSKLFG